MKNLTPHAITVSNLTTGVEPSGTIGDMLVEKGVMPQPEFVVGFCPNCYTDTGHYTDTRKCRDCGT